MSEWFILGWLAACAVIGGAWAIAGYRAKSRRGGTR